MARTHAEKKRLIWTLIAIAFFFANLTLLGILIINSLSGSHRPAPPPSAPATLPTPPAATAATAGSRATAGVITSQSRPASR